MKTKLITLLAITAVTVSVIITSQAQAATPSTAPAGSSFDSRLALRKQEQNVQLDEDTTKHIQQTCTRAQSVLRARQTKTATVIAKRSTAYNTIDSYLFVTIGGLKLANQPTFTLEQQRAVFSQKATIYQTTGNNYKEALGDLLVLNCQSDPAGFQALLNTARGFYDQLLANSQDMRAYTVNTVQPTLQTAVDALQAPANTSNDDASTGN